MRRRVVAAIAGIATIFAGSVYFIDRLTSADTTVGPTSSDPSPDPPRPPAPDAAAAAAPRTIAPPDEPPAPPPVAEPVEVAPDVSARLAASSSQVRVVSQLEALQARVTSRCGAMVLKSPRNPADPTAGLTGQAVILLDLQAADGQARVTGSKILSQGTMRPALTACAQYALRNQVFPASPGSSGSLTVPVVLSMTGGSP